MKSINKLFLFSMIFIYGCQDHAVEQNDNKEPQTVEEHHEHEHEESPAIELNNGAKWKVEEKMMGFIRKMESDVNAFASTAESEYTKLSQDLKSNIDSLTSNCTMTGKAHDELHKWLLPYIEMVNTFADEKTEEKLKEIRESFTTFNQYFE